MRWREWGAAAGLGWGVQRRYVGGLAWTEWGARQRARLLLEKLHGWSGARSGRQEWVARTYPAICAARTQVHVHVHVFVGVRELSQYLQSTKDRKGAA